MQVPPELIKLWDKNVRKMMNINEPRRFESFCKLPKANGIRRGSTFDESNGRSRRKAEDERRSTHLRMQPPKAIFTRYARRGGRGFEVEMRWDRIYVSCTKDDRPRAWKVTRAQPYSRGNLKRKLTCERISSATVVAAVARSRLRRMLAFLQLANQKIKTASGPARFSTFEY